MGSQTSVKEARKIQLQDDGQAVELPVPTGSEGEVALDIRKLRASSGLITLDPGFASTGSCRSAIPFTDGEKGILRYRGYPIEELAEKASVLQVAHLWIHGERPGREELETFTHELTRHTMLHESSGRFFGPCPRTPIRCRCAPRPWRPWRPATRCTRTNRPSTTPSCG
jgi:citrate synthase